MTDINPTYRKRHPPTDAEVLEAHKLEINKELYCVRVGVIKDFNKALQTATIIIAQKQVTSIAADGTQTLAEYPLLKEVPVVFPCGGGFTLTFPVKAGDECLVMFSDRELDNWLINGAGLPPTTGRLHDISDAVAIVGLRSHPRALAGLSDVSAQLRSDDGSVYVDIAADTATVFAPHVKTHAGVSYSWDVNGYGQKITWTGGSNWTIDNYTIGAVVTTNNHAIAPPEAP